MNKFRPLSVGYLDAKSSWADFVELVRRPVESWAKISDEAVSILYEASAGNPFFTKFICGELYRDMLQRRDAYIIGTEMRRAIQNAVFEAGPNQFQHFWDDGIVASTEDRAKHERIQRRRTLLCLGETLRSGKPPTIENISRYANAQGLSDTELHRQLIGYEKRQVLVKVDEEFRPKVGLFGKWLVESGLSAIALTLAEEDALRLQLDEEERLRVTAQEVCDLIDTWDSYRGLSITEDRVRIWLQQFGDTGKQRSMFSLLKSLRFFSGSLCRQRLREGHEFVLRELASRGIVRRIERGARKHTDNVLISYYGGEGKRGPVYAKMYAEENRIFHDRIVRPGAIGRRLRKSTDVAAIVFVDDFIGTGGSARQGTSEAIEPVVDELASREIAVYVVSITGFTSAAEKVERGVSRDAYPITVHVVDPLGKEDRCFSDESTAFPELLEREEAKEIAREYGARLIKKSPLGYGNCQALVVLELTCPNNTLPILWSSKKDWQPLFRR